MMNAAIQTRTPFGLSLNGNQECRIVFYGQDAPELEDEVRESCNDSRNLQMVKFNLHNARLLTYCDGKPISVPDFILRLTQCVGQ